jgi:hypothetical protein
MVQEEENSLLKLLAKQAKEKLSPQRAPRNTFIPVHDSPGRIYAPTRSPHDYYD